VLVESVVGAARFLFLYRFLVQLIMLMKEGMSLLKTTVMYVENETELPAVHREF
jgi:hypothetical protein